MDEESPVEVGVMVRIRTTTRTTRVGARARHTFCGFHSQEREPSLIYQGFNIQPVTAVANIRDVRQRGKGNRRYLAIPFGQAHYSHEVSNP